MSRADADGAIAYDEAEHERAVAALLDERGEATAGDIPSGGGGATTSGTSSSATAVTDAPNPMVAVATAMLEAQGPRPTFSDFATVPHQNPFTRGGTAAPAFGGGGATPT